MTASAAMAHGGKLAASHPGLRGISATHHMRGCHPSVSMAAGPPGGGRLSKSKRLQQLMELDLEDGWSVQPTPSPSPAAALVAAPPSGGQPAAQARSRSEPGSVSKRRTGRKKVMLSQNPLAVSTMMSQRAAPMRGDAIPASPAGALASPVQKPKKRVVYVDDDDNIIGEEDEDEDVTNAPVFSLTIDEGVTEFEEYDRQGNVIRRDTAGLPSEAASEQQGLLEASSGAQARDRDHDDWDFSAGLAGSGWGELAMAVPAPQRLKEKVAEDIHPGTGAPLSALEMESLLGGEGAAGSGALLQGVEQEAEAAEWGLEELRDGKSQTLMEALGVVKPRKSRRSRRDEQMEAPAPGTLAADDVDVQWGGSGVRGVPAGADLAEQEALLSRIFKPHKVRQLMEHQRAAYEASLALKRGGSTRGKFGAEAQLHRQLRIVAGSAANMRLLSSRGAQTRPMMEKVRAAIFNMILSQAGMHTTLPPGSRWLDIFAGTGSVGLEAASRGATQVHFVEADSWVCRNVLGPNISTCGFNKAAVVHTSRAEDFLRRARDLPRFAGGAFDFVSMCPPYLLVSYPELFSLLDGSPLVHDRTILFVEFPQQLAGEIPETLGQLVQVRCRKYGRTWIAVYGPPTARNMPEPDLGLDF